METEAELTTMRHRVRPGLPFGDDQRARNNAVRARLETTTCPGRGREKRPSPFALSSMTLCVCVESPLQRGGPRRSACENGIGDHNGADDRFDSYG